MKNHSLEEARRASPYTDEASGRALVVTRDCADPEALVAATSEFVGEQLTRAISQSGQAVLAVSGGRSPKPLLERLSQLALEWSRVVVVLVDERAVGAGHPLSNTAAIRRWLIRDRARLSDFRQFVPATTDSILDPCELSKQASAAFPRGARIDVAVLGLGLDGHFASIFPGMRDYENMIDPANEAIYSPVRLAVPPAEAPVDRVSLTMARLIDARYVVLPLAGPGKRAAFDRALRAVDADWPLSLLLHQRTLQTHVWLARS